MEYRWIPSWVKILFPKITYFAEGDEWLYIAIVDDRTCADCGPRDGRKYRGDLLRLEFPWLEVEGSDTIAPRVHPNCRCVMFRYSWLHEHKVRV